MHDLSALANRLKKNQKHRRSWASRLNVEAYRLYEFDIPELRYIIDRYGEHIVVYDKRSKQEEDDPAYDAVLVQATADALGATLEHVHLKRRRRMPGTTQYERMSEASVKFVVREETSKYLINVTDYLDTGLFLDHRPMRSKFRKLPAGKSFLNLFAYTGSVTVAAAQSGAKTVSVDMSNTYIDWARENLKLNDLDLAHHTLIREDVLKFIQDGPADDQRFDVIFLDPPTFSNSKKMDSSFDIQRDQRRLVDLTMKFLAPSGVLYFSTNRQIFHLDPGLKTCYSAKDITKETIPEDFRDQAIHRCFELRR